MSDPETIGVYEKNAQKYAGLTDKDNFSDPWLKSFISACGSGDRVLDLGCGPGTSAAVMAQAGLDVVAIDASPEMVALAAQKTGVHAHVATFADIPDLGTFSGVWANFSLLHAPRHDMPKHLADIHAALEPDGVFFIALKTGDGENRDKLGRFYTYYGKDELFDLLSAAGFTVERHRLGSGTGLDGSISEWISVAAHA